jgi:hypothetical protein
MRALGAALISLLVAFSCAKDSERPPPTTCVGKCGFTPGLGSGASPEGGSGNLGEGGGSSNSDDPIELTGNVLLLNDDQTFRDGEAFTGQVDLRTEDASGRSVTALWNGSDPFSFPKVRQTSLLWVLATPQNSVADDALPVLEPVRTDDPNSSGRVDVTLALVRASTIDQIFDLSTVPLTADGNKAQVILLLKQRSSAADPPPAAAVTVSASSAENVLYGASGGFSDVATVTDNTGVVVLANVPGAAWPGALVSVSFSGAQTSGATVPVVNGAVTVAALTP